MVECDKEDALALLQDEVVALWTTFGEGHTIRITADGFQDKDLGDVVTCDSSLEEIRLPWSIQVRVDPSMCGDMTAYIQYTLKLIVGEQYPEEPDVVVSIENPKGLDCDTERHIRDRLVKYLQEDVLTGDMHGCGACIMPVVFHAIDIAQEYNAPHGLCVFCLEDLKNVDQGIVTKVDPCFHCFHTFCFQKWYGWKQQTLQDRVKELHKEHNNNTMIITKAMKTQGIVESGEYPGQYIVSCPCCRGPVNSVPEHIVQGDMKTNTNTSEEMCSVKDLPLALRESVERLQGQFSKLMTIQKEHNGLIEKQPV